MNNKVGSIITAIDYQFVCKDNFLHNVPNPLTRRHVCCALVSLYKSYDAKKDLSMHPVRINDASYDIYIINVLLLLL